jgi:hypothetical protein
MWIVEPDYSNDRYKIMSVVHPNSIVCTAHLLPVFKDGSPTPREINFIHALDTFKDFYLDKYIDYLAFETVF